MLNFLKILIDIERLGCVYKAAKEVACLVLHTCGAKLLVLKTAHGSTNYLFYGLLLNSRHISDDQDNL